ncbi:MAG: hypothetical protein KF868_21670 [Acidobacteria bacterium]|nr:hypothetical protein [Acidobacteriota bacterium]MCW5967939.1 hypothetical protein [Blastocatellales bacterium]
MSTEFSEMTTEQLHSTAKTLRTLVYTVGVVALLYAVYLIYRLVAGTFDQTTRIALIPLMVMVVASIPSMRRLSAVRVELAKRETPDRIAK